VFCAKQKTTHWQLRRSGGHVQTCRLSFFNNQEEVVKRFAKACLEMGA
jgi:hypothetical protein